MLLPWRIDCGVDMDMARVVGLRGRLAFPTPPSRSEISGTLSRLSERVEVHRINKHKRVSPERSEIGMARSEKKHGRAPKFARRAPKLGRRAPKLRRRAPKLARRAPKLGGRAPKSRRRWLLFRSAPAPDNQFRFPHSFRSAPILHTALGHRAWPSNRRAPKFTQSTPKYSRFDRRRSFWSEPSHQRGSPHWLLYSSRRAPMGFGTHPAALRCAGRQCLSSVMPRMTTGARAQTWYAPPRASRTYGVERVGDCSPFAVRRPAATSVSMTHASLCLHALTTAFVHTGGWHARAHVCVCVPTKHESDAAR